MVEYQRNYNINHLYSSEFSNCYIQITEELKLNSKEATNKINLEKANLIKYKKQSLEHKNEILNSEGMMDNSNFFIEIEEITFVKEFQRKLSGIYIKIVFGEEVNTSKKLMGNNFNERFEL